MDYNNLNLRYSIVIPVTNWISFMRAMAVDYCNSKQQKTGGEGTSVEFDEAKFGRRKYNKDRVLER